MAICYHLRKIVDYSKRWRDLPLILIEIAIFIIAFARTRTAFLDIIIMSKGNKPHRKDGKL